MKFLSQLIKIRFEYLCQLQVSVPCGLSALLVSTSQRLRNPPADMKHCSFFVSIFALKQKSRLVDSPAKLC